MGLTKDTLAPFCNVGDHVIVSYRKNLKVLYSFQETEDYSGKPETPTSDIEEVHKVRFEGGRIP